MGWGCGRGCWRRALRGIVALSVLLACAKSPTRPRLDLPVESGYRADCEVSYWKDGKKAVVSVAFDDARPSHWQLAAPALEEHGYFGAFNLNTKDVRDWEPWRRLYDRGHEIGSHTHSHANLATLSLAEAEAEIRRAVEELSLGIPGIGRVVSFSYPYGSSTPEVRAVCQRYHVCQRVIDTDSPSGINRRPIGDSTLAYLKGYGVYPPYDRVSFGSLLDETIRVGGWLIVYWHSLSVNGPFNEVVAPYDLFLTFLDDLQARSDSLWVATQAEVARYVLERERAHVTVRVRRGGRAIVVAVSDVSTGLRRVPLTVRVPLPRRWQVSGTVLDVQTRFPRSYQRRGRSVVEIGIAPGETAVIRAFPR